VVSHKSELAAFSPNNSAKKSYFDSLSKISVSETQIWLEEISLKMLKVSHRSMIFRSFPDSVDTSTLAKLFNTFGSDKSRKHKYENLYANLLEPKDKVQSIIEIGIGSTNSKLISNMGSSGIPGASLRAFRDYCTNALIIGADVDHDVLFTELRISTFHVDQNSAESLNNFFQNLPQEHDLIIDDGLHLLSANLRTFSFALERLIPGGSIVIEDIKYEALSFWTAIAAIVRPDFDAYLFDARGTFAFIATRKET
jgi:hypothetical protein